MKKVLNVFLVLLLLSSSVCAFAHPGRTDKYGGHTEKSTGQYHIHNEDGTITYTQKPTTPKQEKDISADTEPKQNSAEQTDTDGLEKSDIPTTIQVGDKEKPIQSDVDTAAIAESLKPEIHIHENKNEFCKWLFYILLFILSFIGLCVTCSVCYFALRLLEGKNKIADYILSLLIALIILPALVGNALYKLLKQIEPKEQNSKKELEDDFI